MNDHLSCIIVDDEPLAVRLLESFVTKTPGLELLASFTDSVEAIMSAEELMLLNCGAGEDSCESLGLQGDLTSPS